jgi:hypothetical protein
LIAIKNSGEQTITKKQPTLDEVRDFAPKLMELTDDVLFGDV